MRPRAFVPLMAVVLAAPLSSAQPPAVPKKPGGALVAGPVSEADEHKLLAQLVEYLHRDTFPPNEPVAGSQPPRSSGEVKLFVENRRKMIGYITTRMRQASASPELVQMYDDYLDVLRSADAYGDELRKSEDEYMKGVTRLREKFKIDVKIAQLYGTAKLVEKNSRVAAHSIAGWWWGGRHDGLWYRRGLYAGATLQAGNIVGAQLRLHAQVLRIFDKYQDAALDYEKKNLPGMFASMRASEDSFRRSLDAKRPKLMQDGTAGIGKMSVKFGWKPFEVTLNPFDEKAKSAGDNAFLPLARLNRVAEVTSQREATEIQQIAESLLDLAEKLPQGKARDPMEVYLRIKADVAFLAGMHANRAAEYQLGADGLKAAVKVPVPAGKVAVRAFDLYEKSCTGLAERPQRKAMEKYQAALAQAYSGVPKVAYRLASDILPQDLSGITDPKFYFDVARLCCMGDNDGVRGGLGHLAAAFLMGYRNTEKARVSPDLAILRETNRETFDNAVALYKDK